MSADPKSLAILAITTTHPKKKNSNLNANTQNNGCDPERNDGDTRGGVHKFTSTDEFVAGCAAAFINTTALFPINKLIFRQMAGGHRVSFAADQMKEEGLRFLYRGILPPLIQKMVSVSIMFGSFGHYKKWADQKFSNWHPVTNLAIASCLTGGTEAFLTPLERVQMLLQDRKFHRNYRNTMDALIKLRTFGVQEYYRGLTCVLLRNGPSNILFFGFRDEIKKVMPKFNTKQSTQTPVTASTQTPYQMLNKKVGPDKGGATMLHDFLSGAILGMCISTLFYPLSVVRTRMQTRAPGTEFLSIVKAFNVVYNERDRKVTRLFHGCLINVLRQFVSWGVINCSYEFMLDLLRNLD